MNDPTSDSARLARLKELAGSSLYRNAYYVIGTHAAMAVLGFVFWVIVARFYTEAEVGYSGAIISAIGLVSLVGHLGMENFLIRFLPGSQNKTSVMNTCLTYSMVATGVVAVVTVLAFRAFSTQIAFVGRQPIFFVAFVAFAVSSSLFGLVAAMFIARRRAQFVAVKGLTFSGLKLFLPLLFVTHFHAFGIVASWGLASIAALVLSLFVLLPRVVPGYTPRPQSRTRLFERAWGYSGMSYIASLVAVAPKFLMPLLVINALGPVENGYFYVAWAIYTVLASIPAAIAQSMFAEAATNKRSLDRNIARSFLLGAVLLVPAVVFLAVFGRQLLLLFGASYSQNSFDLLRLLALASLPTTVLTNHFSVLRLTGRMRELLVIRSGLTAIKLTAVALLVAGYGIEIIGWTYLICQVAAAAGIGLFRTHTWRRVNSGHL